MMSRVPARRIRLAPLGVLLVVLTIIIVLELPDGYLGNLGNEVQNLRGKVVAIITPSGHLAPISSETSFPVPPFDPNERCVTYDQRYTSADLIADLTTGDFKTIVIQGEYTFPAALRVVAGEGETHVLIASGESTMLTFSRVRLDGLLAYLALYNRESATTVLRRLNNTQFNLIQGKARKYVEQWMGGWNMKCPPPPTGPQPAG